MKKKVSVQIQQSVLLRNMVREMFWKNPIVNPHRWLWKVTIFASCSLLALSAAFAKPRTWTSANGHYTLEADIIAFDEETVVLKKADGDLLAVQLADLSVEDREFVESKEADEAQEAANKMQIWTSVDGMKVRGRVLDYGKKTVSVQRKRGKVYIDATPFEEIDPLHQKVILKVISKLEQAQFEDEKQLTEWAKSLGGNAKQYPLEGVLMELESGDEIAVPFFLFARDDLAILEPGWQMWLEQHQSDELREKESFMIRAQAQAYQADRQARRQIELLKLDLLAAATGATSIWQVGLIPKQGTYGRPLAVMVTAQNSEAATILALRRYPGYELAAVRRASRR